MFVLISSGISDDIHNVRFLYDTYYGKGTGHGFCFGTSISGDGSGSGLSQSIIFGQWINGIRALQLIGDHKCQR